MMKTPSIFNFEEDLDSPMPLCKQLPKCVLLTVPHYKS